MSRRRESEDKVTGVVVINKHEGVTSYRIVQILRRLYNTHRVGHTGTLDPMATGVLPILVGRAVKAADFIVAEDKEYIAEMTLGYTTDTEDCTGEVLTECSHIPEESAVMEAIQSFVGDIEQIPPMYSAIKVDGQKLVDMAREGIVVERKPRTVTIHSIEAEKLSDKVYKLRVTCSKGTYIRTLCADIGEKLGCGAVMSKLTRTRSGGFDISHSYTLEQIENMTEDERAAIVAPTESLFTDKPKIEVNDFYAKLIRGGTELYQKKLKTDIPDCEYVRIIHNGEFIALGQVTEFPQGSAVKPVKLFVL